MICVTSILMKFETPIDQCQFCVFSQVPRTAYLDLLDTLFPLLVHPILRTQQQSQQFCRLLCLHLLILLTNHSTLQRPLSSCVRPPASLALLWVMFSLPLRLAALWIHLSAELGPVCSASKLPVVRNVIFILHLFLPDKVSLCM